MNFNHSPEQRILDTLRKTSTSVKTLVNNELRRICREEGLPTSGVKSMLQERIIGRLRELAEAGNEAELEALNQSINPSLAAYKPSNAAYAPTGPYLNSTPSTMSIDVRRGNNPIDKMFKIDFMHEIRREITIQRKLPAVMMQDRVETHRHTFKIDPDTSNLLKQDSNYRVMVLCGTDYDPALFPNPIRFPGNMSIEVNNAPYPKSLRAIKKKTNDPVHGADITNLVRKHGDYDKAGRDDNHLAITYGNNIVRYAFQIYLVYKHAIPDLVKQVRSKGTIPKSRTVAEHFMKEEDSDIQATAWDLPLKDQSTGMRITLPVKTPACKHVQCFDAEGFFMLFEQSPRSICGLNNCPAPIRGLRDLAVDEYMTEILDSVNDSVDQVTINPDGTWKAKVAQAQPPPSKKKQRMSYNLDESDDETSNLAVPQRNTDTTAPSLPSWTPNSLLNFSTTSREPSATTSAVGTSSGTKRKAAEVVDLTFSSDEDDEPPIPQIKRTSTSGANELANGAHGSGLPFMQQSPSLPSRPQPSPAYPNYGASSFGSPGVNGNPFSWPRG